jgi:hypothetical protein
MGTYISPVDISECFGDSKELIKKMNKLNIPTTIISEIAVNVILNYYLSSVSDLMRLYPVVYFFSSNLIGCILSDTDIVNNSNDKNIVYYNAYEILKNSRN